MGNPNGLSDQDVSDLQQVYQMLPQGDGRKLKLEKLLGYNVTMTNPQGQTEAVPRSLTQDKLAGGYKMGQAAANEFENRAANDPEGSGMQRLGRGLYGMTAPVRAVADVLSTGAGNPTVSPETVQFFQNSPEKQVTDMVIRGVGRTAHHSVPYVLDAGAAEGAGANVQGMESAAERGNVGGVYGEAAVVPTAMALTYGATKAIPVAGAILEKAGGTMSRGAIEQVLRPAAKAYRFGKDPVGFVLDNNITAKSLPEFRDAIGNAVDQKVQQLNDVLNKQSVPVDLKPAAKLLRDQIDASIRARNVPLTNQLKTLYQDRFGGQSLNVSASDAAAIKRGIQDSINWEAESPGMSNIKKQLQRSIADSLHQAVPESAPLDEEISSGIEAKKAADLQALKDAAGTRPVRKGGRAAAYGAGAGAAVASPMGPGAMAAGATTGAAAGRMLAKAAGEPGLGTRIAQTGASMERAGAAAKGAPIPSGPAAIVAPAAGGQQRTGGKPLDKASAIKYFKMAGGNLGNYSDPKLLERAKQLAIADGYDPNNLSFNPQTDLSVADLM